MTLTSCVGGGGLVLDVTRRVGCEEQTPDGNTSPNQQTSSTRYDQSHGKSRRRVIFLFQRRSQEVATTVEMYYTDLDAG